MTSPLWLVPAFEGRNPSAFGSAVWDRYIGLTLKQSAGAIDPCGLCSTIHHKHRATRSIFAVGNIDRTELTCQNSRFGCLLRSYRPSDFIVEIKLKQRTGGSLLSERTRTKRACPNRHCKGKLFKYKYRHEILQLRSSSSSRLFSCHPFSCQK